MSMYKYQMHMHTYPCSKCGRADMQTLLEGLAAGGYAGGVITNHFLRGNTGISRDLSWEAFVDAYTEDYETGKKLAKLYGLDLYFGVEEGVGGGKEILIYGLTPEELSAHSELNRAPALLWKQVVNALGGVSLQAHPLRHRGYITDPTLLPREEIDGFEVYNYCNTPEDNALQEQLDATGMILISGGDAHSRQIMPHGGIVTHVRPTDEKDFARILKSGEFELIRE